MPRSAPSRRTIAIVVAALAIVVVTVIGLVQTGDSTESPADVPSVADARAAVRDAPPALRALYDRGGRLIDVPAADVDGFLQKLRGHPAVINVWAEWCDPCRAEFPLLRTAAARHGTTIAFLGVNVDAAKDHGKAEAFLGEQPTIYPSLTDPDEQIARRLEAPGRPSTVFLDAEGEIVTVRQGAYGSIQDLERDLRLYAGLEGKPAPGTTGDPRTDPEP
ncbi:MAG: TlpA family protein disulfide reductase [Patulibacter sp.]|nr:TlpA family protein disulfide reductase [Patulibacter sp.]